MNTSHRASSHARVARDHYAEVTNQVIAALEAGTAPWRRPWNPDLAGGPSMPRNAITGARYRGINVLTLGMSPFAFTSADPRWATYKQASDRGWQVRKGERSTIAFFFKRLEVRDDATTANNLADENGEGVRHIPLLRSFALFHASQIDGIPPFVAPTVAEAPWRAPDATDVIVSRSGAIIRTGGDRAFYSPATDHIQMPPAAAFESAAAFRATLLHEMSHWSGAASRLNRDLQNSFGSHDYAREELRAELGSVMVCTELALPCDFANSTAYLASWIERLRSHRKEIFRAAADAQRIADFLLEFHPDWTSKTANDANPEGPIEEATAAVPLYESSIMEAA